ncbi:tRNA ligase [Cymbomonas tetramitiformis]|uniref:tRNA ligase n=1 Tax=Cymbomonas tetramitiformis TaxID=36881 RepID=A0AAE0FTM2_9CHLO|nr:tRNA ligase [Cymbomonas tetramitiformis]
MSKGQGEIAGGIQQRSIASFFGGGPAKKTPKSDSVVAKVGDKRSQAQADDNNEAKKACTEETTKLNAPELVPESDAGHKLRSTDTSMSDASEEPKTFRRLRKANILDDDEEEEDDSDGKVAAVEAVDTKAGASSAVVTKDTQKAASPAKNAKTAPMKSPMKAHSPKPKTVIPQSKSEAKPQAKAVPKSQAKVEIVEEAMSGSEVEEEDGSDESSSEAGPSEDEGELQGTGGAADAFSKLRATSQSGTKKKRKAKSKKASSKSSGVGDKSMELADALLKYDPKAAATWAPGKPVPYSFLASTFEKISEESKRLLITEILANAFRTIIATTPEDLLVAVYLSVNQVAPSHEGKELGIGDATLIKALGEATGRKESTIKSDYNETGDLGTVAMASRGTQKTMFKPAALTCAKVLAAFREISSTEGKSSMDKKRATIQKLLVASQDCEPGYIIRSLQGKLRIGLAQQTVLVALAHAALMQEEATKPSTEGLLAERLDNAVNIVKQVYSECPTYDKLIPTMLEHGLDELPNKCTFEPGVPIKPMLAKPTTGVQEILTRFTDTEFTCEYKYDGERAQVHLCEDGSVKAEGQLEGLIDGAAAAWPSYGHCPRSRVKFPDLVAQIPKAVAGWSDIVGHRLCEAVAYDRVEKKILPFQVLSTRSRKTVSVEEITVNVCLFAFDCIYLNGKVRSRSCLLATCRRPLDYSREITHRSLISCSFLVTACSLVRSWRERGFAYGVAIVPLGCGNFVNSGRSHSTAGTQMLDCATHGRLVARWRCGCQ